MAARVTQSRKQQASWTTRSGQVLTDAEATRLADSFADGAGLESAEPRRVGRPALSSSVVGRQSPRVSVRLREEAFALLKGRAEHEQRTVSEVARDAIEVYLRG